MHKKRCQGSPPGLSWGLTCRHAAVLSAQAVRGVDLPLWSAADGFQALLVPIPAEPRRVALRNYQDKSGGIVHEGSVWDANDPFVTRSGRG